MSCLSQETKQRSSLLQDYFAKWNISSLTRFAHLHLSADNTANILTRRGGFSRREMSMYFLPVVISDNDYPIQSSTSTLIVRVCACDSRGNMQSCNPEVLPFSDGLTTGALVAILLCVIILLSKSPRVWACVGASVWPCASEPPCHPSDVCFFVQLRSQSPLGTSAQDDFFISPTRNHSLVNRRSCQQGLHKATEGQNHHDDPWTFLAIDN